MMEPLETNKDFIVVYSTRHTIVDMRKLDFVETMSLSSFNTKYVNKQTSVFYHSSDRTIKF